MKRILLLTVILYSFNNFATEIVNPQLLEVNVEWKNHSDGVLLSSKADFSANKTFDDWIATHLMLVEQTLRQRSTNHLDELQKQNRLRLLDELNGYWHSHAFSRNDYLSYKNPIFIDRNENYCAVGFLMKQSGAKSLAQAIDADNKFVFVKDIKTQGVKEWAKKNGFTIDELAWIQPGYPVNFSTDNLSEGLNGTVNCMLVDSISHEIYAGGSFTSSFRGVPCNGIAQFISGFAGWDWIGVGGGLNGTVKSLLKFNNKIYVAGSFSMAGGSVPVSNVAAFDLFSGQWEAVGILDSTVNSLVVYNNEIYAGGVFSSFVSKWNGSQWVDVNQGWLYDADVRALEVWNNTLIIGGDFELPTGAFRKNVATYDGVFMANAGFGTTTPVNDFTIHRDTLYAACDFVQDNDSCALAKFDNNDWVCELNPSNFGTHYESGRSIQHLLSTSDRLFCSGNFPVYSWNLIGNNLMEFKPERGPGDNSIPLMFTDTTINTIERRNNSICFGGAFTNSTNTLNYIGELTSVTIDVPIIVCNPDLGAIKVFPNPASDIFNVDIKDFSENKDYQLLISDITGREVYRAAIVHPSFSMDIRAKNMSGIYLLQLVDENGKTLSTQKLLLR